MSSYRNQTKTSIDNATHTTNGPDQSFTKAEGVYAGAKRMKGRNFGGNSMMSGGPRAMASLVSPSSICESYKNVDFFAVKEPYQIVRNKFDITGRPV